MDRKGSSKAKKIIVIESVILIGIVIIFCKSFITDKIKYTNDVEETKAISNTEDMFKKQEMLMNSFKDEEKLIIASGNINMSYIFSNKDKDVMLDTNDNYMKTIWNKLFKQEIKYNTCYSYNMTYRVDRIETEIKGDKLFIRLWDDFVKVEDISEQLDKTSFDESYGWLAEDFTPKEIKAIQKHCKVKAYNYLVTNEELKSKASNSLKKTIDDICKKLDIKKYSLEIVPNYTITNKDKYTQISEG